MRRFPNNIPSLLGSLLSVVVLVGSTSSADGSNARSTMSSLPVCQLVSTGAGGACGDHSSTPQFDTAEEAQSPQQAQEPAFDEVAERSPLLWDRIPQRDANAMNGTEFIESLDGLKPLQREQAIVDEILAGNIPSFLRQAVTIETSYRGHRAVLAVMPDYLAVGSDDDFVRVPVNAKSAQKIADAFGGMVPTKKVVDEVYKQADVKLAPRNMYGRIADTAIVAKHNARIEHQRRDMPTGVLTAGHKKDLINARRAHHFPDRVCIYGWHDLFGRAIQPLSTIHEYTHVDYSHGLRLMAANVWVDGELIPVAKVLQAKSLSRLLSHEGTLKPRLPKVKHYTL